MRVKIIPADVRKCLEECRVKYDMTMFERTSCGVAYVLGQTHSYNPYYASAQLAKCGRCPMKKTCFDRQEDFAPTEKDLELVRMLEYKAEIVNEGCFELCKVNPEKRTECVSCCTSCFKLKRDAIEVQHFDNQQICLGDIGLLRLLTKKLVFCKGVIDSGDPTIAHPKNPLLADSNLYILNSWSSFSRNTTTASRVEAIRKLKANNIDVLPIVHPYIHGYSRLNHFATLEEIGIKYVSWKWLRYNPDNMSALAEYIPQEILNVYSGHDENEILAGDEYIRAEAEKHGLTYVDLKKYIQRPNSVSGIIREKSEREVRELSKHVVFSTSDKSIEDVIEYAVNRRL